MGGCRETGPPNLLSRVDGGVVGTSTQAKPLQTVNVVVVHVLHLCSLTQAKPLHVENDVVMHICDGVYRSSPFKPKKIFQKRIRHTHIERYTRPCRPLHTITKADQHDAFGV